MSRKGRPASAGSGREEVVALLSARPELSKLVERQPDEPDAVSIELLVPSPSPFYVVRIPIPGRKGVVCASRLPGSRAIYTENEVTALVRFGIDRIVCLVPTDALESLHGAYRYIDVARSLFRERFHQLEIPDHDIPPDDDEFERLLVLVDGALLRGEKVLVHCVGGCGRTGTFTACLMVRGGLGAEEAIQHFRRYRRCGPETPEQVAYVARYASRLAAEPRGAGPGRDDTPPVWCTRDAEGRRKLLARGGLGSVYVGRIRLARGGTRRVAVKCLPALPGSDEARRQRERIDALRRAGVRLPRMFVARLSDGSWAQVSPLFGSLERGSKLHQPGQFYRRLDAGQKRFAIEQLTRIANAGYTPSIDLFLLFTDESKGILPLDLDLIEREPRPIERARALARAIVQTGSDSRERDELLEVARDEATEPTRAAIEEALAGEANPYRALWSLT